MLILQQLIDGLGNVLKCVEVVIHDSPPVIHEKSSTGLQQTIPVSMRGLDDIVTRHLVFPKSGKSNSV